MKPDPKDPEYQATVVWHIIREALGHKKEERDRANEYANKAYIEWQSWQYRAEVLTEQIDSIEDYLTGDLLKKGLEDDNS